MKRNTVFVTLAMIALLPAAAMAQSTTTTTIPIDVASLFWFLLYVLSGLS